MGEEESLAIDSYRLELEQLTDSLHQWEWFSVDTLANPSIDSMKYAQYLAIKLAIDQKLLQITSIKETRHNAFMNKMGLLDTLNNNITTSSLTSVQNIKTVNGFLLQRLSPSFTGFTTGELHTLDAIALQCPSLGGEGVYHARVLWAEASENFDRVYNDNCLPATSGDPSPVVVEHMDVQKSTPIVFPNPAITYSVLRLPEGHHYRQLIIFNTQGQKVLEVSIAAEQEQVLISTKDLPKGLYLLHLDSISTPIKLIIN